MALRQTGRRVAAVSTAQRKRTARRACARRPVGCGEDTMRPREQRQLIQLVLSSAIFVLFVAVKLLLPGQMAEIDEKVSAAMGRNMDVRQILSVVGRVFEGDAATEEAADQLYQAVFSPDTKEASGEVKQEAPELSDWTALQALQEYRTILPEVTSESTEPESELAGETSVLTHVLYSEQNLPENVSLEQEILGFAYCTPVRGAVSSGFGYRDHPVEGEERFHYGIDLAADTGTEISCFADGCVTVVGESSSYGKYCIVAHQSGYSTLYAHCSRITTASGKTVSKGETIAEVGETGTATGPHLHFELLKDGDYLNPIYYVSTE